MYPFTDSSALQKKSPEQLRGGSFYEADPGRRTMRQRFETIFKAVWQLEMSSDLQAAMSGSAATPSEAEAGKKIETNGRTVTAAQAPVAKPAPSSTQPAGESRPLDLDEIRRTIDRTAEPTGSRASGAASHLPPEVVDSINLNPHAVENDERLSLGA